MLCAGQALFFPSLCVKPIDWFCLLLPPTLMLSLIVLICPQTQKVRRAAPHFWIALTFALHMLSGSTDPGAKQKQRSLARGCVTARQRCTSFLGFFFFFHSPTEDDVYVIDFFFFGLLLSPTTFRCSALSSTESGLDQCIVFLSQSHSNEPKTRKVMQVRFGREEEQSFWSPPSGLYVFLGV